MLEQLGSLSEATSQPCDICAPEPDWLSLVNVIRNPPSTPSLEWCSGNGKPRAGVLAYIALVVTRGYHIELACECSECDPFASILEENKSNEWAGFAIYQSRNVAIDRHKNLQLAASSRRTLMLKIPLGIFRRNRQNSCGNSNPTGGMHARF
jgi:hypothetical protein